MNRILVVYYSKKGSTEFLAKRVAEITGGDIEPLKPRFNNMLSILLGLDGGNRRLKNNPADYDKVILCGPVWVGVLLKPMVRFIKRYVNSINALYYLISCASSEESKDDKFGYGAIVKKVENLAGDRLKAWQFFSILDVLTKEEREDSQLVMNTRLNSKNFTGPIADKLQQFIDNNIQ